MTTAATTPAPSPVPAPSTGWSHDFGSAPAVPITRLVRVELRKMLDTRAGLWLIASIVAITALVLLIFFLNAEADQRTFFAFSGIMAIPQSILLPILGILLVTQEWGQRTGMVTFALTPSRGKVIGAKVAAAFLLALAAFVVCTVLAVLATIIGGAGDPWAGLGADDIGKFFLLEAISVGQGLAFGLIFLNSAVSIVTYLVLPQVISLVASLWSVLRDAQPWIDLNSAGSPLYMNIDVSGEQWAHLGVALLIWLVAPLVLGLVRVLRAELK